MTLSFEVRMLELEQTTIKQEDNVIIIRNECIGREALSLVDVLIIWKNITILQLHYQSAY